MAGTRVSEGESAKVRGGPGGQGCCWKRSRGQSNSGWRRKSPRGDEEQAAAVKVIYKGPGNADCHRELKQVSGTTPSSTLGCTHRVWGVGGTGVEGCGAQTWGSGVSGAKVKEKRLDWGARGRRRSGSRRQVWRGKRDLLGIHATVQGWDRPCCWMEPERGGGGVPSLRSLTSPW